MALTALVVVSAQATRTLAGTTGALTGYVVVQSGAPVADAKITVSATSQTATSATDAKGHFAFVSLTPDTYTLTANKDIPYQVIISTIDAIRRGADGQELFPDINFGVPK